jgi:hypothetical protein
MLAESYFSAPKDKKNLKVLPEEKIQLTEETGRKTSGDPDVDIIAATLKRQADSQKW